jgi:hypothetical protein
LHFPGTTLLPLWRWYIPNPVDRPYLRVRQLLSVLSRGCLDGVRRGCTLLVFEASCDYREEEDDIPIVDMGTDG